ncbi:MAG: methylated-DNA--[protein]-cysteine S-methyltransferase [Thiobacillus sp.]|nr:methylated-DNA--[protein]-cysteine S-methyltransferase [Thiobacillus sp.]
MSDYDRIADAIAFIANSVDCQPNLDEVAAHVNLSPFHFQRLFSRWAGVSPKKFLQVLTVERAKLLLEQSRPLLEVSHTLGLSSGSRLHDHFVQIEAMTPGEFKLGGLGLAIDYAVHDTPFGRAFIASTARGICRMAFLDASGSEIHVEALRRRWPHARLQHNSAATRSAIEAMFGATSGSKPLAVHVSGTNFQVNVWKALIAIPPACVASYADIAWAIGRPRSARVVGLAMGANPVAYLIPCHRVIRQSGALGGYRWGEARKQAMHSWEAARFGIEAGERFTSGL